MGLIQIEIDDDQLLRLDVWLVLVKARAGFKCEKCEKTNRLAGHYKDEDPENNRLSNGEALCGSCHSKQHPNQAKGHEVWKAARRHLEPGEVPDKSRKEVLV